MMLKANTAVDVLIGPFVDKTDGNTTEDALTLTQAEIKLSKNGQALTQKNDATSAAFDDDGYYNCELDATDTNTEGSLVLIVHQSANALPVRHEYDVLSEAAWDSLFAAKDTGFMDVNVKAISEDTTAADNSEAFFDGTGYAGTNNVIPTVSALTGHTAQTGDTFALANGAAGFVAIDTVVDTLATRITAAIATKAEMDTAHGLLATEAKQDIVDTNIDTLLTRITALIATKAEMDTAHGLLATEAKQDIIDTNVDTLITRVTAAVATEAKQDLIKAVTDALTTAAATTLALSAGTIVAGTQSATAGSATEIYSDDVTDAQADLYNGRIIIVTSGALKYLATDITDYAQVGGEGYFTVTAMPAALANNVTFIIV